MRLLRAVRRVRARPAAPRAARRSDMSDDLAALIDALTYELNPPPLDERTEILLSTAKLVAEHALLAATADLLELVLLADHDELIELGERRPRIWRLFCRACVLALQAKATAPS